MKKKGEFSLEDDGAGSGSLLDSFGGSLQDDAPGPGKASGGRGGGIGAPAEKEIGEKLPKLRSALQQMMADQVQRQRDATDSEFWVAFCFQTREQKEEFLRKTGILQALDADKYVDGMEAAKILGVELKSRVPKWSEPKISKRLVALT